MTVFVYFIGKQVITDITRRMGAGMAEFVTKDLGQGTVSIAEYNRYCHYVAGLVGEGLTRLFCATGVQGPELLKVPDLSNRYHSTHASSLQTVGKRSGIYSSR